MSTLALYSHTFDPRAAGTLLADFDRLLELVGDRGLALSPKHAFAAPSLELLFDFGDDWRFEIVAERPEAGPLPPAPLILDSHGEAPAQYDAEEWDE